MRSAIPAPCRALHRVCPDRRGPGRRALALALVGMLGAATCPQAAAQDFAATVRAPTAPRQDPAAVTVVEIGLPGQQNQPSAYKSSVAELLVGQPGVQVRSSGGLGQFSGAVLRGAAPNQVAVLIDGVPISRGSQAAVDLSLLPIAGLERIEIYRGAPPIELGVDAIGGVINLITRRGKAAPTGWATLGGGSFGRRLATLGYSSERPGLRISASASYQGAVGDFPYYFNEGLRYGKTTLDQLYRRQDGFDQGTIDLRVTVGSDSRGGFVQASGLLKQQGVAGVGQPGGRDSAPELRTGRALLLAGGQGALAGGRVQLSGDAHALIEQTRFRDLTAVPVGLFTQLSEQTGARLVLRINHPARQSSAANAARHAGSFIVLAEGRYERLEQSDLCSAQTSGCPARPAPSRVRLLLGLGGELRLWNGRFLVQPGGHLLVAQSDTQAGAPTAGDAASTAATFPAPRLAARLQVLPWLLIRTSGGRFVRLPTFLELFGDHAFFRPSLSLRPESAWSAEAGLAAAGTPLPSLGLSLAAHGFYRRIDDLIDVIRDGPTLHARNVGTAQAAGVELEARVRLGEALQAQLNYTFLDARDRSDDPARYDHLLPGRAPHTVFARFDGGYKGIRLFYELDYAAQLYLDPANLQPRPQRTLHALGLQLEPRPFVGGHLRVQLAVEVRNLLDTRLVLVTLPLAPERGPLPIPLTDYFDYPLPGRAVYATLSARL